MVLFHQHRSLIAAIIFCNFFVAFGAILENQNCNAHFAVNFNDNDEGIYSIDDAKADFGEGGNMRGFGNGRGVIVKENDTSFIRAKFPAGCKNGANCGIRAMSNISAIESNEIWYSYKFRYPETFNFTSGGILPGLCSGENCHLSCADGAIGVRGRWFVDGYIGNHVNRGNDQLCGDKYAYSGQLLETGKWYQVEQYIRFNTINETNGIIESFLDGAKVFSKKNFSFSNNTQHFDWFVLQAYFQNSNENRETWVDFDELNVLTCENSDDILNPAPACPSLEEKKEVVECWLETSEPFATECADKLCQRETTKAPLYNSCEEAASTLFADEVDITSKVTCNAVFKDESFCDKGIGYVIQEYCSNPDEMMRNIDLPEEDDEGSITIILISVILALGAGMVIGGVVFYRHKQYKKNQKNLKSIIVQMPKASRNPLYIEQGFPVPNIDQINPPSPPLYRRPSDVGSTYSGYSGYSGSTSASTKSGKKVLIKPPGNHVSGSSGSTYSYNWNEEDDSQYGERKHTLNRMPSDLPDDEDEISEPGTPRVKPRHHHRRKPSFSDVPFLTEEEAADMDDSSSGMYSTDYSSRPPTLPPYSPPY